MEEPPAIRLEQRLKTTLIRQKTMLCFILAMIGLSTGMFGQPMTKLSPPDYVIQRRGSEIEVNANEVTSSDEAAFHHVVEVEVTVNGARHFLKSWSVTVPRKLN